MEKEKQVQTDMKTKGSLVPSKRVFPKHLYQAEEPIPSVYSVIDTDLARDNLENDLSPADLQDLQ